MSKIFLKTGWILVSVASVYMYLKYSAPPGQLFSPTQQYLSEIGYSTSNARSAFVLWGTLFATVSALSFSAVFRDQTRAVLILPVLLFILLTLGMLTPLDTMPWTHSFGICGAVIVLGLCALVCGIINRPSDLILGVTIFSALSLYAAFEITQADPVMKEFGLNPQHHNGPVLQKIFFTIVLIAQVWLLYMVAQKNWEV